jgi:hypothetical protein
MNEDEYHQAMLERMQELSEALDRAEAGNATPTDWIIIRSECGMSKQGEKNEHHSQRINW